MCKKGSFEALKEDALIFKKLEELPSPNWWELLCEDKELYIDIRKDNYINVYYYGCSLAKITANTAKIHKNYGYKNKNGENSNSIILEDLTKEEIEKIKCLIKEYKGKAKAKFSNSEKYIQGTIILNDKNKHIDSEFAFELKDEDLIILAKKLNKKNEEDEEDDEEEDTKLLRIDLTEILDGKLSFIELKRIGDGRLNKLDKNPEILTQMDIYAKFIERNQDDIIRYYEKLIKIKKKLGLLDKSVPDTNLTLDIVPKLMIVDTYEKMTEDREERIEDIKKILTDKIKYKIKKLDEIRKLEDL